MNNFKKGFTLIELLVVIAIIAILTAVMLANFSTAKSRSRDVKRISDLSQLQLALAGYFDRCSVYPPTPLVTTSSCTVAGNTIVLSSYISSIPTGPSGDSYVYSVDSSNGYDDYFIHATLENNNSPVNNSLSTVPGWYTPGVVCSQVTKDFCVGPK